MELAIEDSVLKDMKSFLDEDYQALQKSKKSFHKASSDMKTAQDRLRVINEAGHGGNYDATQPKVAQAQSNLEDAKRDYLAMKVQELLIYVLIPLFFLAVSKETFSLQS